MDPKEWLRVGLERLLDAKSGRRPWSWEVWFGEPETCPSLSDGGKSALRRVIEEFEITFGSDWLAASMSKGRSSARRVDLSQQSPLLATRGYRRGCSQPLLWWAVIELTRVTPGRASVIQEALSDTSGGRFAHSMTQLRLAACALLVGMDVSVEDDAPGWRADVLLRQKGLDVPVEVVTIREADRTLSHAEDVDRQMTFVCSLARAHRIGVRGEVPGPLDPDSEGAWTTAASDAAEQCVAQRMATTVAFPGVFLEFVPDESILELSGPSHERDVGRRVAKQLHDKAKQVKGSINPWIWLEDTGFLSRAFSFRAAPLNEQLIDIENLVRAVLADHPHLAGIAVSHADIDDFGISDATLRGGTSAAVLCHPTPNWVRTTLVFSRAEDTTATITDVARAEQGLIDAALKAVEMDGTFDELFASCA